MDPFNNLALTPEVLFSLVSSSPRHWSFFSFQGDSAGQPGVKFSAGLRGCFADSKHAHVGYNLEIGFFVCSLDAHRVTKFS